MLPLVAAKLCSRLDEQSEDDGTIIAGEVDQIGLGDEAAKLDQLARSLAPLHLPFPRVMPRPLPLKAMAGL